MSEAAVKEKLTSCFRAVFPTLPEASIPGASVATVSAWDSIAAITLLHVIEEEFQTEMDLDKLAELDSFDSLAVFLSERVTKS
jgi:acyl carrier protein